METLQEKRAQLEKELRGRETAHAQTFGTGSPTESTYQYSYREITRVYAELSDVCKELGNPIPIRF